MADTPERTETSARPASASPQEERRPYSGGGASRGPSSFRGPSRDSRPRRDPRDGGPSRRPRRFHRGKVCFFCVQKVNYVDYKSLDILRRFITDRGKILPRRITGTCARHQRGLTSAIKRSRNIALIPFKAQ